jgi:hypothetical protein
MKPPFPSKPLSAEALAALERLETAQSFEAVRADYARVYQEATARSIPALIRMLPGAGLYAIICGGALHLGWIRLPELFTNLLWLLIICAAVIGSHALCGVQAMADDDRVGRAVQKWKTEARKAKTQ